MNRRGEYPPVQAPMRVTDDIVVLCRKKIDSPAKACVRRWVNCGIKFWSEIPEIGEGFQIGISVKVPQGSRLGRYGYIGRGFQSGSPVSVGDLCMISTGVNIVANDHDPYLPDKPMRLAFNWGHQVTVFESDVWVGHGAVIRSGLKLARGSVIAAGSVVTKDVDPYTIVGGNPARVIRARFTEDIRSEHDRLLYGAPDAFT